MKHRDFVSQPDRWEEALHRDNLLEHRSSPNKPAVESRDKPYDEVMGITELEVFLNEMSNAE